MVCPFTNGDRKGTFKFHHMAPLDLVSPLDMPHIQLDLFIESCQRSNLIHLTASRGMRIFTVRLDLDYIEKLLKMIRRFYKDFVKAGVQPPENMYFEDKEYMLFLRATLDLCAKASGTCGPVKNAKRVGNIGESFFADGSVTLQYEERLEGQPRRPSSPTDRKQRAKELGDLGELMYESEDEVGDNGSMGGFEFTPWTEEERLEFEKKQAAALAAADAGGGGSGGGGGSSLQNKRLSRAQVRENMVSSVCPLCDKQLSKCEGHNDHKGKPFSDEELQTKRVKAWEHFFMMDTLDRKVDIYRQIQKNDHSCYDESKPKK